MTEGNPLMDLLAKLNEQENNTIDQDICRVHEHMRPAGQGSIDANEWRMDHNMSHASDSFVEPVRHR